MAKKTKKTRGAEIIEDLTLLRETLRNGTPVGEKFTLRTVELRLEQQPYDAETVKRTRKVLGVSQAVFAQLLGASTDTVQSWEQGVREPCTMACRLLDLINKHREHWLAVIRESSKSAAKECAC